MAICTTGVRDAAQHDYFFVFEQIREPIDLVFVFEECESCVVGSG